MSVSERAGDRRHRDLAFYVKTEKLKKARWKLSTVKATGNRVWWRKGRLVGDRPFVCW